MVFQFPPILNKVKTATRVDSEEQTI